MTTGQSIARKLLDDEQWQREGLVNWAALAEWVDRAIEDRDRDWAHALKQAVESQFPQWSDPHEWPSLPDVDAACAWLKLLIEEEREACARILDEEKGALNGLGIDEKARGNLERANQVFVRAQQVKRIGERIRARSLRAPVVD